MDIIDILFTASFLGRCNPHCQPTDFCDVGRADLRACWRAEPWY